MKLRISVFANTQHGNFQPKMPESLFCLAITFTKLRNTTKYIVLKGIIRKVITMDFPGMPLRLLICINSEVFTPQNFLTK